MTFIYLALILVARQQKGLAMQPKTYDGYAQKLHDAASLVVGIANDHALLRKSSHEMDERLYYSIVLLAEVVGVPIITHEVGKD